MKSLISFLKLNQLILKNIFKNLNKKKKFLFYSESKSYQKYCYNFINLLSNKFPNQVLYVSSDIEDRINNPEIENLFIGNGFLMKLFFQIIKADYFFLTLTDLDNHSLRKTKNINNYVYYFHAPVSTFKNYTQSAFDNYDIIFCNGDYHLKEIRKREEIKNLTKKNLIRTGYFYFDYLLEKISSELEPEHILIAPSWNYDHKNFLDENFIKLIDILVNKKNKVIFRPHPEHFKRSKNTLALIKDKFANSSNFYFDDSEENFESIDKSKCLITDASGISIEFLVATKRPVLYLSDKDKIHNKDYSNFNQFQSIDKKTKDLFGYSFYAKDIDNIDFIISENIKNFQVKVPLLNNFIKENFFNFGSTKKKFDLIIENLILDN